MSTSNATEEYKDPIRSLCRSFYPHKKINAIKAVRDATKVFAHGARVGPLSLKYAKMIVDEEWKSLDSESKSPEERLKLAIEVATEEAGIYPDERSILRENLQREITKALGLNNWPYTKL